MTTNDWEKEILRIAILRYNNYEDARNDAFKVIALLKERDISLIAELEGMKDNQENAEHYNPNRAGNNKLLDLIISNLRERIQ